MDKVFFFSIT